MAPILALLAEKGLTLIADAVMAKGQQVVEKELGVKLTEKDISNNSLELKKLEFQHEAFLLQAAQDKAEIDLKEKELTYQDTANARGLGIELSKAQGFLNQNIMPILALIVTISGMAILIFADNSEVRMAAVSMMTMVLGYFFGSSTGSHKAQEFIRGMKK